MVGYHTTNRGRYKCDFCDQRSYKTVSGINTHVQAHHELELERATSDALRKELERERRKAPKIVEREKVVYKDKPDPKYWYHSVFCTACKEVIVNAGIPYSQTIESTPHGRCGTRSLMSVERGV